MTMIIMIFLVKIDKKKYYLKNEPNYELKFI